MRQFASPSSFAAYLAEASRRVEPMQREGLKAAGELVAEEARQLIGTEDDSWPPLADSTVAEKQRLGYTGQVSATDPLLRTGDLRDSIGFAVRNHDTLVVGSTDPVAVYQEVGTWRIPPRPFISAAMYRQASAAISTVVEHVAAAVGGRAPRSRIKG